MKFLYRNHKITYPLKTLSAAKSRGIFAFENSFLAFFRGFIGSIPGSLVALGSVLLIAGLGALQAAEPHLQADLSENNIELGEQVELQIKISDASSIKPPENIQIEGLEFGGLSQSTQRRMNYINGSFSSSETITFTIPIIPKKTGTFTIPPIVIEANGKKLMTRPLSLTVSNNAASAASAGNNGSNSEDQESTKEIAKAELIVSKQSAYLGEAIPMELRFYFDARVQVQLMPGGDPQLKLDGFTMQKLTAQQQKQIEKDGRLYNCLMFKTVVTPAKTGKLELGPVELPYVAVVPIKRKATRPRTGSPFDMLNDPMFNGMMPMAEQRRLTVQSGPLNLEVKPLPAQGKPKNFSGAVGLFKMETSASPLKLNLGDPLTVKMQITGRGNSDRVTAPQIVDEDGWRSYPATGKFTPDDDAGISGIKAFEMAVIPQEKKATLPILEFSYFDPVKEIYVTLKSDPTPITITGQAPQEVAKNTQTASPAPSPTPQTKPKPDDLFYITDSAHWGESFEPIYTKRSFWLAQIIPAIALLAFIGLQILGIRKNNAQAKRLAELQKQKSELLKTLNRLDTQYTDFFEAAVSYLQLETARTTGRDPSSISSSDAIASRTLTPEDEEAVQWIFNSCAEHRYTGDSSRTSKISDERRSKVLTTLKHYETV